MTAPTSAPTARLELRLPAQEKADIEEAARISGRTVTEYVRSAAREAARMDLARSIQVSAEVFDALLVALDSTPPANPAMARAHARAAELGL
ncbi:DUF1778 domain-containing protein [Actinomyces bowdenii]|uniref:type II toxin-antitoxin system TacA family antitoxin n=1 Tax=Actinomyces bowdenii TaxID=131109 RepID=UPI00214C3AC8|nr:DUF1778 domain-containing protein [Actinomyces bowdenii]MCR2052131.1 DUF1778 domain-containing protein [Actinomyces bowdenii]